jgi:hydroxymethylpyrimidine/phosphomethylpyrimidine kinase
MERIARADRGPAITTVEREMAAGETQERQTEWTRARAGADTCVALSIAGSDSSGGAGIQADLKAFARCGVHGTCAITAVTAQDTAAVHLIHALPPDVVVAQARAVIADLGVHAVKVGMLANAAVAAAVAQLLDELPAGTPVVVDPVIVASSGERLLDERAQAILVHEIAPRATVLTPNIPEARWLAGSHAAHAEEHGGEQARRLLLAIAALGPRVVVLTGGHRQVPVDLFWEAGSGDAIVEIPGERHRGGADHGSGCTHSAVLAAELAHGATPLAAARRARELAGLAIAQGAWQLGSGGGPVDVLGTCRRGREL